MLVCRVPPKPDHVTYCFHNLPSTSATSERSFTLPASNIFTGRQQAQPFPSTDNLFPSTYAFAMNPNDDVVAYSLTNLTQAVGFSSGNPRIEEIRGVMHLFRDEVTSSTSQLPVERKPLVCVLGVPNHMTYADFCQFCGSFVQHMLEMRIIRNDGMEERYSVLIRFDSQESTDIFYKHLNGKSFSSFETEACHILFVIDVQYTGSIGHTQTSLVTSTEQPTCPVCLERLDQDTSGILITICNHSFHCSCISKWTDSSCPVCRYCQQQPEKSICFVCQTSENLWICVICGFVGCRRYNEGHAMMHWKETQHCYSLELETQRVWDYVGDNYVHRLIQSKTDGKLVELNFHCSHTGNGCGHCECSSDPGISEAILNSKFDAIRKEYDELLNTQLENQRLYFESLLQEAKEETDRETSEAVEKALSLKLQKMQVKLDKCIKEKRFQLDITENVTKNLEFLEARLHEIEEREMKSLTVKDNKIQHLEHQLRDLLGNLEVGRAKEEIPTSDETKDAIVLPIQAESSVGSGTQGVVKTSNQSEE